MKRMILALSILAAPLYAMEEDHRETRKAQNQKIGFTNFNEHAEQWNRLTRTEKCTLVCAACCCLTAAVADLALLTCCTQAQKN